MNLTESVEALGFDQLVYFETHDRGHTLDHMYAPEISDIKVTNCYAGSYISDHCFVFADLRLRKDDVMVKTIKTRCFKKLDLVKFCEILDFDDLFDINDLDCLVEAVDVKTVKALDQLIPVTTMRITERRKEIWFNDGIKQQRVIVRKGERIWRYHKNDSHYQVFKMERNELNRMFAAKKETICETIVNSGNDSKELFSLINIITGARRENPLPVHKSDKDLADQFADFFLEKILKIREALRDECLYKA
ncbi:hypothetical protein HOLleu_13673 [Holothuria leucospilota]|uniref:Uncharacterized protein n=1 Tax=Holothuria leucospilota TaxID=206669 RepID=A0A9Q1C758_HOLLE|nr:hypothetical protein HOLleu_13673 [Holothuria leucospilota]